MSKKKQDPPKDGEAVQTLEAARNEKSPIARVGYYIATTCLRLGDAELAETAEREWFARKAPAPHHFADGCTVWFDTEGAFFTVLVVNGKAETSG